MSEENKALMRRFYEEAFNRGNLGIIDELAAANFVDHAPFPGQGPGTVGLKESFASMRAAFPDIHVTVDQMVAEGDKVATHITIRGTHRGEFMGVAPTGQPVTGRVSDVVRFAGGKAVERWGVEDMSGMLPGGPPPGQ